jgi:antitoxin (DNA-binding transcriptional repressor) of toxin-antitoxin stability system
MRGAGRGVKPCGLVNVATSSYIEHMISAGIRDLKNNLSRYISRLRSEKRIVVTDRGRAVAELRLPEEQSHGDLAAGRYAELIATGVIRPAQDNGDPLADWPAPNELELPPGTVTRLIDEDRGDR